MTTNRTAYLLTADQVLARAAGTPATQGAAAARRDDAERAAGYPAARAEAARTGALVQVAQLSERKFRMVRPDGKIVVVCVPGRDEG